MHIWLRYITGGTTFNVRLDAIDVRSTNVTKRAQRFTLRDAEVDHLLSRRAHYDVLIGADQMTTPANADWMEEFWCGEERYLCLNPQSDPVPPDAQFIQVVTDGGASPRQWLEDHADLPFYPLTLRKKRRD